MNNVINLKDYKRDKEAEKAWDNILEEIRKAKGREITFEDMLEWVNSSYNPSASELQEWIMKT